MCNMNRVLESFPGFVFYGNTHIILVRQGRLLHLQRQLLFRVLAQKVG